MNSRSRTSSKISTVLRWLAAAASAGAALAVTASAWAASGPLAVLAQAGPGGCPCPGQSGFLAGTAGYAVRWLVIIVIFVLSAVGAYALGRSRKRAEQAQ